MIMLLFYKDLFSKTTLISLRKSLKYKAEQSFCSTSHTHAHWKVCDSKWLCVCVCVWLPRGLFCHLVLPGLHTDARLPQRDQIMILCSSLRGGCRCRDGGMVRGSAEPEQPQMERRHSWRQQMWNSCQLGVSRSLMTEMHTCCPCNDTNKSSTVC